MRFWARKKTKEATETTSISKVIVGLGNPENGYKGTRHNVGFETINKLAYDHNISVTKSKHRALVGLGTIAGHSVLLVKPQTYMNRSGESVRAALDFYKLEPSALIVVYDEISLELGNIRVRERGSAGGHNGMKDIISHLKTDEFARVRIGIGPKPEGWILSDFVLSGFPKPQHENMIKGVTLAGDAIEKIITDGTTSAMNFYNKNNKSNKSNKSDKLNKSNEDKKNNKSDKSDKINEDNTSTIDEDSK